VILLTAAEVCERPEVRGAKYSSAIAAILLATAGAEAFIHEVAQHIDRCHKARDWSPDAITPSMVAAAAAVYQSAGTPLSLLDKYVAAAQALGKPFDAGSRVLKDFSRLVGLQNAILLLGRSKTERREEALTDELAARGIAKAGQAGRADWFDRLQTRAVARWACRTTRAMILATVELIPVTSLDLLREVQETCRHHRLLQVDE